MSYSECRIHRPMNSARRNALLLCNLSTFPCFVRAAQYYVSVRTPTRPLIPKNVASAGINANYENSDHLPLQPTRRMAVRI
ncbi:hypothetical protein F4804DRAFT_79974 [Jackrogersella minutella]|nr:hypothetical protein F4804DRAFT_79974 [Jackrogersella minutella]